MLNGPMLFQHGASPAEYKAGRLKIGQSELDPASGRR
jgi:hypothetical protein